MVSKTVWGHVLPDVLLVLGKTSSSIILLSVENKKGCKCSHPKSQGRSLVLKEQALVRMQVRMQVAPALRRGLIRAGDSGMSASVGVGLLLNFQALETV